ncbi:TetR/AcrR family transcriptional regulator [Faecalicatena contorta]|uniref:TetR/AcrR family transcriptional regulator n=2 Tax=Bacillota TaxID=1239 RepID=UPI000AC3FC4A|nr:TetR/AcrR family transcriptional regulator [Faecalicatena contorta]
MTMTRITKDPKERRQEIIDTSMKVFYEKGYEKTTIADIAREMHVAQGLCYRYFSSKEELFDTALDQYAQRQVDRLLAATNLNLPLAQLIESMPSFPEVELDDSYAQKLCHQEGNAKFHNQLALKICAKLQPVVARLLARAGEGGELQIKDPDTAASFCVYGQLGILLDQNIPASERTERIHSFLLELIRHFQA